MTVQDITTRAPGHGKRLARRRTRGDDRKELLALLVERKVPGKVQIMRAKALIRELADRPDVARPNPDDARGFISAYYDLYLARISGDSASERSGLQKCLTYLGEQDAAGGSLAIREGRHGTSRPAAG